MSPPPGSKRLRHRKTKDSPSAQPHGSLGNLALWDRRNSSDFAIDRAAVLWQDSSAMLKGISPLISPSLLKILCEMGHGDEIVFGDAHFPGHSIGPQVVRADGIRAADLLRAIEPLFELDSYAQPVIMMGPVRGDTLNPAVEQSYRAALRYDGPIERLPRNDFYKRAALAHAVVMTSETAQYGNIILKKGVTPSVEIPVQDTL